MSKAKPFLVGTTLGASAMFFALQYHMVQTQDGFRVLPRAPQQSLGLTYADIRGWSPSQWTDRPELARALMAHGSSDLIADSVSNTLRETVTDDSSTLDELRTFLNRESQDRNGAEIEAPKNEESDLGPTTDAPSADPFRIPFPQDAKLVGPADPFRLAATKETPPTAGSRFSADDVRSGLTTDVSADSSARKSNTTITDETRAMKNRIFGNDLQPTERDKIEVPSAEGADSEAMFEDITSQLESRANAALNRARSTTVNATTSGKPAAPVESAKPAAESFLRGNLKDVLPGSAVPAPTESTSAGSALESLEFDPFLE